MKLNTDKLIISDNGPRVITLNTLFNGRCYILDNGNESKTYWHINLPDNDSVANLFVLREGGENALTLGIWHYPIQILQIHNRMYQTMILKKELHLRTSTTDSPCMDKPTKNYYKVRGELSRLFLLLEFLFFPSVKEKLLLKNI